jgi:hypothetical protein
MKADWRDRLGICLSALCLAHCLLTPFVIGLLPVGAMMGFWHHGFHRLFLVLVSSAALLAFLPGWRAHRDSRVWYWGGAAVILLTIGILGHAHEEGVEGAEYYLWLLPTIFGGAAMIRAHFLNRKLCACCAHGHSH